MTTCKYVTVKCGVCGHKLKEIRYGSIHFGEPFYLDGFSFETGGPTVCPHCNYMSYDISAPAPELKELVNSDYYQNYEGLFVEAESENPTAGEGYLRILRKESIRKYYRHYLLSKAASNAIETYCAMRDMAHHYMGEGYAHYLPEVYELFLKIFHKDNENHCLIKLDYLRQLGRFNEALSFYEELDLSSFKLHSVSTLVWEKNLINLKDSKLYHYNDLEKYKHGLDYWHEVVSLKPQEAQAYELRAKAYCKLRQYDLAEKDYSKAIELEPKEYSRYLDRAEMYKDWGQYEKALEDYDKAIALASYPNHIKDTKGELLEQLHRYREALEIYLEIGMRGFDSLEGFCKRSVACYKELQQQSDESLKWLKERIAMLDIYFKYKLKKQGYCSKMEAKELLETVIEDYARLLAEEGDKAEYYVARARAYYEYGEFELALADVEKTIAMAPNHDEAYVIRGQIHVRHKEYEAALEDYSHAIAINLQNVFAYKQRLEIYRYSIKDAKLYLADCNAILSLEPHNLDFLRKRAWFYAEQGDLTLALSEWDSIISLYPEEAYNYKHRLFIHKKLGNYESALRDCEFVLEREQYDKAENLIVKAELCEKLNMSKMAHKAYKKAIAELNSLLDFVLEDKGKYESYCDSFFALRGLCYTKLGNVSKAKADFAKAKELEPDFDDFSEEGIKKEYIDFYE